jgi:hypothetical protein
MAKIYSDDPELFWTTDLGLASALLVEHPLAEMDGRDPAKVALGFVKSKELNEYLKMYWDKELRIEPQAYYSELLMLRKRINQELNN